MNKRGNIAVLLGFVLFIIMMMGAAFVITVGSGLTTYISDEINTATSGLGEVGGTNMTQVQEMTVGVANTSIQQLSYFSGAIVFVILIAMLSFATIIRSHPNKILISAFIMMTILLIVVSIVLSNAYEEIYEGTDEFALELQGMTLASFLLLHMPMFITVISFIGGIIIFTGVGEDEII